jgi:hypothetical protein
MEEMGATGSAPLPAITPFLERYLAARAFVIEHPVSAAIGVLVCGPVLFLVGRRLVQLWYNQIVPRLTGTRFAKKPLTFPTREMNLRELVQRRPAGKTLAGLAPPKGALRRWRPVYLSERQRSAHRHVLGKTGSGKTHSVLFPQVLQDVLDGKGNLFLDGKGSNENRETMLAIAADAKREKEVRTFSLPAWNQPQIFSHTYNLVHVTHATEPDESRLTECPISDPDPQVVLPSVKRRPESSTVPVFLVLPAPIPMDPDTAGAGRLAPASLRSKPHARDARCVKATRRVPPKAARHLRIVHHVRTTIVACEHWLPRGPIILLFALLGRQVGPACASGGSMGRGAIYPSALDCGQGITRAHPPKTMTCRNHRLLYSEIMPPRPQSA